jgi:hypothetical protein
MSSPIDSFGRDDMLAAGTDPVDPYPNCTVSNYLSDTSRDGSIPNGVKMTAVAAVLIGTGVFVGSRVPRIGRPIGAAVGAGAAGLALYGGYKVWQLDGGRKICKDWLGPLP